jgi:hypothetical protein
MDTALSKMRTFIESFPDIDMLEGFQVDYASKVPDSGGLFPSGLVELSRNRDILGNVETRNQYNFALYTVLVKSPDDDDNATANAEWLMRFQEWIQEQSVKGLAPTFGDVPRDETITAENGTIFEADEEGTAVYVVQISVTFTRKF